jgi:TetR/AcrR family transcriptional regulator, fatty acid biosynthesis regulator
MNRPRARRMSPESRRQSIIEAAVELILQVGRASCTLEQVADQAGISKPLIYKYFPRREALLEAILEREFEALRGSGLDSVPDNVPVERVIRATLERALRYYHDRGPILRLLATDPAVAELARAGNRSSRANATSYFVERLRKHYRVPDDVATIAVTMAVNAPIHSMTHLKRQHIDLDRTIDVWTEFMLGGWRALQERYGTPPRR